MNIKNMSLEQLIKEDNYVMVGNELKLNWVKGIQAEILSRFAELTEKVKELEEENSILKTHAATSDFCSAEWKKELDKLKGNNLKNAVLGDADKIFLKNRIAELTEKVKELEAWKESALSIEAQWNPQKVAKLLNIGLGELIIANIEPKIVALLAENDMLKKKVENMKCCGNCATAKDCEYEMGYEKHYCDRWNPDNLIREERK